MNVKVMLKEICLFLTSLLILSCNDAGNRHTIPSEVNAHGKAVDVVEEHLDKPTGNFEALIKKMDSMGYTNDTLRVEKLRNYKELTGCEIRMFGKFPFYKMTKEKAKVLWWNTTFNSIEDSIDTEIFKKAESAWAYFYRNVDTKEVNEDGVIEQWKFADELTARTALRNLNKRYPLPYFNTEPYYIIDGQFLYIFQTRASSFSYIQKEFAQMFLKICSNP